MSDFTDPNGQIPFDAGNADVPQSSQSSRSSQSDSSMQTPTTQQCMQNQPYGQPYDQSYRQQPVQSQPAQSQPVQSQPVQSQPAQSQPVQPDYGQAAQSTQYGQPAYSQTPQYARPQSQTGYDQQAYRQMPGYQAAPQPAYGVQQKSKLAAGLFGIFLGALGVHNFYLGFTGKAVAQLLLTLIGWILFGLGLVVAWIWGFVEGILILCSTYGSNWHRDAKGIELSD